MTYEYTCPKCGPTTRTVPIAQRNDQVCDCGKPLMREFPPKGLIMEIPTCFRETHGFGMCEPQNDEERKNWNEWGVTPVKPRYGRGTKVD